MLQTKNNSFSVEALVAKYRNFVMENTPITKERDGYAVIEYTMQSADFQLISKLYKDVMGNKADQKVIDIMSAYIGSFKGNALTSDEYNFLCDNYSEFLEYEFINKKGWNKGCAAVYDFCEAGNAPIIDLNDVAGVPAKTLQFLKEHCYVSEGESLFVSGDDCGDIKSLFTKNADAVHSNKQDESWALNTIRYSVRSNSANLTQGIPSAQTQDVVIYFDYDSNDNCSFGAFGKIIRDLSLNGSDKKSSLSDAYNMLTKTGRMYIDISRDQLKKGSEIYQDIQKMLSEKVVTSILSYESNAAPMCLGNRCLIIVDKKGSDDIVLKSEMAEKSVAVSYNDIDKEMLWPGYYYNKRQKDTIPLSELVDLDDRNKEAPATASHFVLSKSLAERFMDSCLSEEDLYQAGKHMKKICQEKLDEAKSEGFDFSDDDAKSMWNSLKKILIGQLRLAYSCTEPCIVLSSDFHVGYISCMPTDGVVISKAGVSLGDLFCLKPKDGFTPQYIAALLCDKSIKLQILRTCEGSLSFDDLKYILDKIYVPDHTPIERERYVTSMVMSAYNNLKKEKDQDLANYKKGIRLRKHALSQSLSSINAMFNTLNNFRKRNFGSLSDDDIVSRVKGFTVADIFERLEKWLPEVMETVDHLADIDYSFGKIESINPETFIEGYISSHDKEWMNFSASVNWIRGNNIAREDIKMNGIVLLKKGDPISSFNFPKDALYRILDNIVSNAKEYAFTEKGRDDYDLHFSWRMNGTDLVIEIANNGTPIPEDRDVRSLLEYGVSSNLHSRGHNGIGCHEIKGIMNRYNGDFEIVSKPQDKYTVRYLLVFKSTNTLYTL